MDQKTNLIVLKTILGISPDRHLDYPIEAVHKKLPELTEEIIEGIAAATVADAPTDADNQDLSDEPYLDGGERP